MSVSHSYAGVPVELDEGRPRLRNGGGGRCFAFLRGYRESRDWRPSRKHRVLAVLDAAIVIDICGATEAGDHFVGEDPGLVQIPFVRRVACIARQHEGPRWDSGSRSLPRAGPCSLGLRGTLTALRVEVARPDDGVCVAGIDDQMHDLSVDAVEHPFMQSRLRERAVEEGEGGFGVLRA